MDFKGVQILWPMLEKKEPNMSPFFPTWHFGIVVNCFDLYDLYEPALEVLKWGTLLMDLLLVSYLLNTWLWLLSVSNPFLLLLKTGLASIQQNDGKFVSVSFD